MQIIHIDVLIYSSDVNGESSVLLDSMSGFEFEKLVADILSKLGYGKIEKILTTQDQGRDILLRTPEDLIVVECKHQPRTSIGRPIVQKLHSAVISSNAKKGVLVTTGRFTNEAVEYAKKLADSGMIIEMVDRPIFADLAARAKINIVTGGKRVNVWTWKIPPLEAIVKAIGMHLESSVKSYPRPLQSLIKNIQRAAEYHPLYIVTYDINTEFRTSVGIIHRIRVNGDSLIFDGDSGKIGDDVRFQFLRHEQQTLLTSSEMMVNTEFPTFRVDSTTLLRKAKKSIIKRHEETVYYTGRNNQEYQKVCRPGERDIHIRDIRQVYVPSLRVNFQILQTPYQTVSVVAPSGRFLSLYDNFKVCKVCQRHVDNKAIVCDVCGRITHSGGFLIRQIHGFSCRKCGRTTCRLDGMWRRRWLIFKELLCPTCAESTAKDKHLNQFDRLK